MSRYVPVPTWAGFLYLAVVVDAWSRRVVGWAMANHLRTELVLDALNMALGQRRATGVIHHSDQGCQGGFKRSSQHLDSEELRWDRASVVGLIGLDVRRCVHLVDRRWPGASIDNASGKRSLEGCRARRPGRWPACPPQSEHVGSVKVVACHRSALPHCRGATCHS